MTDKSAKAGKRRRKSINRKKMTKIVTQLRTILRTSSVLKNANDPERVAYMRGLEIIKQFGEK